MSEKDHSILEDNENTTPNGLERRRVPGSVYYYMPLYSHGFWPYCTMGSFGCRILGDYVSPNTDAMLWIGYAISVVILALLNPKICRECRKTDKEGKEVTVRYPLVRFRAYEVELALEGIEKGYCDKPEGEETDERIHDGYRYGTALLRI